MPSKHMTHGRQALKRFEAHLKAIQTSPSPAPEPMAETAPVIPEDILVMSHSQMAQEIASIRDKWLKANGEPRIVRNTARADQRKALNRLALLKHRIASTA